MSLSAAMSPGREDLKKLGFMADLSESQAGKRGEQQIGIVMQNNCGVPGSKVFLAQEFYIITLFFIVTSDGTAANYSVLVQKL